MTLSAGISPSLSSLSSLTSIGIYRNLSYISRLTPLSHLSPSSSSQFYITNTALCLSSTSHILWILLYPDASSMPRRWREPREYRRRYPACNLCGEKICSFSTTEISEILYRNAPKDLNILPPHNPWIYGRPADLDDIHFDEM